jgi:hypothetical protein
VITTSVGFFIAGSCAIRPEARFDEVFPDLPLAGLVRRERPVGHDEARDAPRGEVVDEVLDPRVVGVAGGRDAVLPALVVPQALAAPVGEIERRIGEDEVGAEVRVEVAVEAVLIVGAEVGVDAADGEVHLGQLPGGVVGLLAIDGDVVLPSAVGEDEPLGGDEHAAGAAAGVEDASAEGLDHLDQELDHALWSVELAPALALGGGEPAEEVLVDAAEDVLRTAGGVAEADAGDEVHELAEAGLVELGAAVVLGEDAPQAGVLLFDGLHSSSGTQNTLLPRYSSRSSGSASGIWRSSARCSSKASEMYLRKMRPRTTYFYCEASMWPRSLSAAAQSLSSKPRLAPEPLPDARAARPLRPRPDEASGVLGASAAGTFSLLSRRGGAAGLGDSPRTLRSRSRAMGLGSAMPRSHWETMGWVTPVFSASCAWVRPAAARRSRIHCEMSMAEGIVQPPSCAERVPC